MPVCPKCRKPVDYLKAYTSGVMEAHTRLENDRLFHEEKGFLSSEQVEYECPECSEVIFTDDKEVLKFLAAKQAKGQE